MTTVFITIPWFLPAFRAGGPIQSVANLVKNYTTGIEYRIFCGNRDLNGESLEVEIGQWLRFNENTMVWYADGESISKTLTEQAEILKPEIIYIIGLFSWHYNIVPLLFCKAPKKILSVRGMLHPGALSRKKIKKRLFLSLLKLSGQIKKTIFQATDETEKKFIEDEFGNNVSIAVAENYGKMIVPPAPLTKEAGFLKLITVALISPMKNHLLVLEALAGCSGNIEYHIYGPVKDADYWQQCLDRIASMPANIRVQYHGEIAPGEVEKLLALHHVFIMPSKSENFGHAIYEALSAGKPVITSYFTPWTRLSEASAGINSFTETAPLREAIQNFTAMDNEGYSRYVAGSTAYIIQRTDRKKTDEQYRNLFLSPL
ncbi:MAG: glycosyltransferase [Ferruginibacter sp.]